MADWAEISQCKSESRRELVLKGNAERKKKIKKLDGELPPELYDLKLLNFLELSSLGVSKLGCKLENLSCLTQLFLMKNELVELPDVLCNIRTLKFLDVSENLVEVLPENIGQLVNLHTFNMTSNKLSSLPESFSNLENLAVLLLAQNKFNSFPQVLLVEPICCRLADLNVSGNEIDDISDSIEKLVMLKNFDASSNSISELTQSIGKCLKLKQVAFKSNPLKDRRLKKLIEQNGSQKSILDYIRSKGRKISSDPVDKQKSQGKGARKKLKDEKVKTEVEEQQKDLIRFFLEVLKLDDKKGRLCNKQYLAFAFCLRLCVN